jgi:DNA-binding HxlR family transcriptional regulator
LTDRGKALLPALQQITLWAEEHLVEDPDVEAPAGGVRRDRR